MHQQIAAAVLWVLLSIIALLLGRLAYWRWIRKAAREVVRIDGETVEPDHDAIPSAYSVLAVLAVFAMLVWLFLLFTE